MSKINFNNVADLTFLRDELKDAIEADKLYWLRNDAKIRAITKAETYDQFKNIVDAAHLKPVSREDKAKPKQINWNRALNN